MTQVKTNKTIPSLLLVFTKTKLSKQGEGGGGARLLCRGCGGVVKVVSAVVVGGRGDDGLVAVGCDGVTLVRWSRRLVWRRVTSVAAGLCHDGCDDDGGREVVHDKDGSDHEDANEHIEKVLEIVDLFNLPNITIDQVMLRAFPMSLTGAASHWLRNKPTGLITTWEDLKTKFLSKYFPRTRTAKKIEEINNFQQEPDKNLYQAWELFKELLMKGAIPSKTAVDAKIAIQVMAEYSQKWHNGTSRVRSTKTSDGLAAIQAQLNNLGREIKKVNKKVYAAQIGCEQCKGPHYTKDCPLKEEGKTLEEAYYTQFCGCNIREFLKFRMTISPFDFLGLT
ncbi:hypothetical protein Tco_0251229 [Tanacetum coccineum]